MQSHLKFLLFSVFEFAYGGATPVRFRLDYSIESGPQRLNCTLSILTDPIDGEDEMVYSLTRERAPCW